MPRHVESTPIAAGFAEQQLEPAIARQRPDPDLRRKRENDGKASQRAGDQEDIGIVALRVGRSEDSQGEDQ